MKNKTQAIKQARSEVGQMYQWGDGYKFALWDKACNAYWEVGPHPYHLCMMHRSESLIEVARGAMGLDPYIYYDGGSWIDYLA